MHKGNTCLVQCFQCISYFCKTRHEIYVFIAEYLKSRFYIKTLKICKLLIGLIRKRNDNDSIFCIKSRNTFILPLYDIIFSLDTSLGNFEYENRPLNDQKNDKKRTIDKTRFDSFNTPTDHKKEENELSVK